MNPDELRTREGSFFRFLTEATERGVFFLSLSLSVSVSLSRAHRVYRKIRYERRRPFSSGKSVNARHGPYSYITRNELSPWSIIRQAV